MSYIPERGDLVWVNFTPQVGREQAGRRPAVILSPASYNGKVGLAIACPITSKTKNYAFEVPMPDGLSISGVILCDQIRNLDWRERQAAFIEKLPQDQLQDVLEKLWALLRS